MGQFAVLITFAGLVTFALGVWLGLRRRWRRMRRTKLPVDEAPVVQDAAPPR
jgi:hypothetical protein